MYKRSTNDWAHFRILNQKRGAGDMHLTIVVHFIQVVTRLHAFFQSFKSMTVLLCNVLQLYGYIFLNVRNIVKTTPFQFIFEFGEQKIIGWSQVGGTGGFGPNFLTNFQKKFPKFLENLFKISLKFFHFPKIYLKFAKNFFEISFMFIFLQYGTQNFSVFSARWNSRFFCICKTEFKIFLSNKIILKIICTFFQ